MSDPKKVDRDKLIVNLPARRPSPYDNPASSSSDRVPSGFDPMGEIQLRGRILRTLSEGNVRWWIMIAGWVIFGGGFLLMLLIVIESQLYPLIVPLAIAAIPLVALWKGTARKLARSRQQNR
jgi:hypothetical protein